MWKFFQPVQVMFGEGEIKKLGSYLKEFGYDRTFLVADSFLERTGMIGKLMKDTQGSIVGYYCDVEPNPTVENVDGVSEKIKSLDCDCIIAFGGGSTMDCAKAAAAAVAMDVSGNELMQGRSIEKALPIVAIPTTAGTASEVTAGAVLSDKKKGRKIAIFGNSLFPKLAVVDPEITYSVPARMTAITGLDVLAHALDAMSSVKATVVTDSIALGVCKLVRKYLERVVRNGADKEARRGISEACVTVGLAFSQTGTTGCHACSYILTSKYQVPHGEACAFTMEDWLLIHAKERPIFAEAAKELGFDSVEEMAEWISSMKKEFGMRIGLSEIGAAEAELDLLTDSSMSSANMRNDIAKIGREGVYQIFKSKI